MSSAVIPQAAWMKEAAQTLSWVTTAALGKPATVKIINQLRFFNTAATVSIEYQNIHRDFSSVCSWHVLTKTMMAAKATNSWPLDNISDNHFKKKKVQYVRISHLSDWY